MSHSEYLTGLSDDLCTVTASLVRAVCVAALIVNSHNLCRHLVL